MSPRYLIAVSVLALCLTACSTGQPVDKSIEFGSQYWQRINSSDAIYTRGPKAQQMLNRDIARCVTELRELEKLGEVRNAIPTDMTGRVVDPDEKHLYDHDTPERDRSLYMEHGDYHDFDGCMLAAGWERVLHVPYDVADEARGVYLKSIKGYDYQPRIGQYEDRRGIPQRQGEYKGINQ